MVWPKCPSFLPILALPLQPPLSAVLPARGGGRGVCAGDFSQHFLNQSPFEAKIGMFSGHIPRLVKEGAVLYVCTAHKYHQKEFHMLSSESVCVHGSDQPALAAAFTGSLPCPSHEPCIWGDECVGCTYNWL